MARWFNNAGPCDPAKHYMLPALRRLPEVYRLIAQEGYFVVHAPRQAGKTTALRSLARELMAEGRYIPVLLPMEMGAPFAKDVGAAESAVLEVWHQYAHAQLPPELQPPPFPDSAPGSRISTALMAWAESAPRPLVIFLDEFDSLRDQTLISVLRQLRSGYSLRPEHFPSSLALIGLRDVRDYQLEGYLAGLGFDSGWLVIFDQRSGQPPLAERTRATAATTPAGRRVTVLRA